ncbi:very short patch repair endonuclease [Brachybacterium paraconglomeratum]
MVTTSDPSRRRPEDLGTFPGGDRPHLHNHGPSRGSPVGSAVSARMSRQRRRDTAPEVALRRLLHREGLRFRVDHPLPGMPRRRGDVVFTRARLVVFVDGCFWHSCPQHATTPATRTDWWTEKLERNVARDRDTDVRLVEQGWTVLRFWEHEDPMTCARAVERVYRGLLDG